MIINNLIFVFCRNFRSVDEVFPHDVQKSVVCDGRYHREEKVGDIDIYQYGRGT